MAVTVFSLVVAIYSTFPHMHTKPHVYAVFQDLATCKAAADHFESRQPERHNRFVAICVPQAPGVAHGHMM